MKWITINRGVGSIYTSSGTKIREGQVAQISDKDYTYYVEELKVASKAEQPDWYKSDAPAKVKDTPAGKSKSKVKQAQVRTPPASVK